MDKITDLRDHGKSLWFDPTNVWIPLLNNQGALSIGERCLEKAGINIDRVKDVRILVEVNDPPKIIGFKPKLDENGCHIARRAEQYEYILDSTGKAVDYCPCGTVFYQGLILEPVFDDDSLEGGTPPFKLVKPFEAENGLPPDSRVASRLPLYVDVNADAVTDRKSPSGYTSGAGPA